MSFDEPTLYYALDALRAFSRSIDDGTERARSLAGGSCPLGTLRIANMGALRQKRKTLAKVVDIVNDAMDGYIVAHITSSVSRSDTIKKLLRHYGKLRSIARGVLNTTCNDDDVAWRVAEECYNYSFSNACAQHLDAYLDQPPGPGQSFSSLSSYDDEDPYRRWSAGGYNDLLDDPEYDYDIALCQQQQYDDDNRTRRRLENRHAWIGFWERALRRCHGGPTLFYPPSATPGLEADLRLDDVPRFLFRAYDGGSAGFNSESVVKSPASVSDATTTGSGSGSGSYGRSRTDLLALGRRRAADLLHAHMTRPPVLLLLDDGSSSNSSDDGGGEDDPDNLVSWSSSLLCAIQHAAWRCRTQGLDPGEARVCAVDTRRFPRGQFARDAQLLRAYGDVVSGPWGEPYSEMFLDAGLGPYDDDDGGGGGGGGSNDETEWWEDGNEEEEDGDEREERERRRRRRRRRSRANDNGRYLSQGAVNIEGRSCTTSLRDLEAAGLYRLYPELVSDAALPPWPSWTKRVRQLRARWSSPSLSSPSLWLGRRWYRTNTDDVRTALALARSCFAGFEAVDVVALLLLCFKDRELRQSSMSMSMSMSLSMAAGAGAGAGRGTSSALRGLDLLASLFRADSKDDAGSRAASPTWRVSSGNNKTPVEVRRYMAAAKALRARGRAGSGSRNKETGDDDDDDDDDADFQALTELFAVD
ncbi:hypothetical protein O9K51_05311 [Purpureocillium lavendulum]|uniref:Uncharacterized protein n=1 Tax=Purpureocillium lavendulum TaxID=1247861 RepID=A0AB34FRA7_9HYPO|nr:hypothetical protein O9K51_05311 [Purpureocillium lavendulum]